jgi:glutamine amidotransferase
LIAIFDYGSGNIRSAFRAFASTGQDVVITSDPKKAIEAEGLVIPGVGASAACKEQLVAVGGDEVLAARIEKGKKSFGICVGMQILFSSGEEKSGSTGLGIFPGVVEKLQAPTLPQIGWNQVSAPLGSQLFRGVEDRYFYFVHSYGVQNVGKSEGEAPLITWANYGGDFVAAIESELVCATQFHPEKSGSAGLRLISNWVSSLS